MWQPSRVAALCLGLFAVSALGGTTSEGKTYLAENQKKDGVTVTASGLQYRVLKSGPEDGPSPKANSPCQCHYRGTTIEGVEFDSSYARGKPTTFAPNQVITGWTEAMQLMREGDKWELTIPSELAYGDSGAGGTIKGGAVLVFEMEIMKVNEPSAFTIGGVDFSEPKMLLIGGLILFMIYQKFSEGGGVSCGPCVDLKDATNESNPRVFFQVQVGEEDVGRIEMELFANICPKTADNFRALCTGEKGKGKKGKLLHFKDSTFHRVIPGFMCQGGDFTAGNGTGGESIYGDKFKDEWENGYVKHSVPFLLSMANCGQNTNGSQFFLTVARTGHLDQKHVVFGQVVAGHDVVKVVEKVGTGDGTPKEKVTIIDCGEVTKKDE